MIFRRCLQCGEEFGEGWYGEEVSSGILDDVVMVAALLWSVLSVLCCVGWCLHIEFHFGEANKSFVPYI